MKRFLFFVLFLLSICTSGFCQSLSTGYQTFSLVGAEVDEDYTYVLIDVRIDDRRGGWVSFESDAYILCAGKKYRVYNCFSGSKVKSLDTKLYYDSGNKGNVYHFKLAFARIPVGYSQASYIVPGVLNWQIFIKNNENKVSNTHWTQNALRKHYSTKDDLRPIEGIYDYLTSDDYSNEYEFSFAIIKNGSTYDIVFLNSTKHSQWKEGELKASMQATATPGLYKISNWYSAGKTKNKEFYATLEDGAFVIHDNNEKKTIYYAKIFPSFEEANQSSSVGDSNNQDKQYLASGTGFIIDPSGYIATNYHVIDGAKGIDILITKDGKTNSYNAKTIVVDKANDLAIIKVNDDNFTRLSPVPYDLGSRTKDVGTSVFAMGYPELSHLGEEIKVTDGIISSKTGYQGDVTTYQISAPIQHGNSGGPLFDKNGTVIGITNAGVTELQNVGYAIKVSYLNNLIDACPEDLHVSSTNQLSGLSFTDKIKKISPYIVIIKIY